MTSDSQEHRQKKQSPSISRGMMRLLIFVCCIVSFIHPTIAADTGTSTISTVVRTTVRAAAAAAVSMTPTPVSSPGVDGTTKKRRLNDLGSGITLEELSNRKFSGVPNDWNVEGKYHPSCVKIWKAYLTFRAVYIGMRSYDGSTFHEVHPELPWSLAHNEPIVFLLMNYMTSNLANSVKNGLHPASTTRSDGTLRSCCWELIQLSLSPILYNRCGKTNVTPFAYPYNGDSTDIFSDENVRTIMAAYKDFLLVVFEVVRENGRTHLCSQAVLDKVTSLLGGKKAFRTYVTTNTTTFFSVPKSKRSEFGCVRSKSDEIETSCHPEFLLNKLYLNSYTERHALRWDYMYSLIRVYLGETSSLCTTGADIITACGGSKAFDLLKLAEQERNARNSERQKEKMRMGTHNFQAHARKMLHAMNVLFEENDNVLSLYQSIVQKEKMKDGKHNFQVHAANMLAMMGVEVPVGGNVLSIYKKELMALGVHPWQVYARARLVEMNVLFEENDNVLSLYHSIVQKKKTKDDVHNFQVHAAKMLEMMCIKVPVGGNAHSIYKKELWALGECNLQNLLEESTAKQKNKARHSQMTNALAIWDTNFDKLNVWDKPKPPTNHTCTWLKNQRAKKGTSTTATAGIRDKAAFEKQHSSKTEWQERLVKLEKLLKRLGTKL